MRKEVEIVQGKYSIIDDINRALTMGKGVRKGTPLGNYN